MILVKRGDKKLMKDDKKTTYNEAFVFVKSFITPEESEIDRTTAKGFIQDLVISVQRVDISGLGAQLAYFFLLSFFPLLIFLVTLLPYLNLRQEQVFLFLEDVMPTEVYFFIEGTLIDVLSNQNGGLLSIGILGTIWSASKGVNALIRALNQAYDVNERSGLMTRAWSLIFTISLVLIILIALLFPVFGKQISDLIFSYIGIEKSFESVWTMIRWLIPPALIFIVLMAMYWVVPNTDPRLPFFSVIPGAIFTTASWIFLTYIFSYYISNFGNFSSTYGSIGGVIILMLWLYFTGILIIFGGLLNASFQKLQIARMNKSAPNK
ncbi:YihY/virulence factor BrkB family protein [Lysinibacillus sp. 54212]|uniref:YihY/virulence factor BrkB family protein n=1 Tax=Lysinibacillus sp. 54212 TaxID=3119829 RepID=UPI003FA59282